MVHDRGLPHTAFPQSGQHAPDNQARQGNPVQDRSHNQISRVMGPSQGNLNILPNIVPLGRSGAVTKTFADGSLKEQTQNKFTDGRLGRNQAKFTDGRLSRLERINKFTDGRLGQSVSKPGPQGFSKTPSVGLRVPTPTTELKLPTVPMPIPKGELPSGRRQVSYDQMYGTTESKQNALKEKYNRANLRKKKGTGLTKVQTGISILDAYKNLGRR